MEKKGGSVTPWNTPCICPCSTRKGYAVIESTDSLFELNLPTYLDQYNFLIAFTFEMAPAIPITTPKITTITSIMIIYHLMLCRLNTM